MRIPFRRRRHAVNVFIHLHTTARTPPADLAEQVRVTLLRRTRRTGLGLA